MYIFDAGPVHTTCTAARSRQRAHIRVQDATITIAGCVFVLMLREFQTMATAGCVVVLILCAFQKAATAGYVLALMLCEFQTIPASLGCLLCVEGPGTWPSARFRDSRRDTLHRWIWTSRCHVPS